VTNNNGFFGEQAGGQRAAIDITLEAVKEFQVVATGASAEFGRTAGGVINVISKFRHKRRSRQSVLLSTSQSTEPQTHLMENHSGTFAANSLRHDRRSDQEKQGLFLSRISGIYQR